MAVESFWYLSTISGSIFVNRLLIYFAYFCIVFTKNIFIDTYYVQSIILGTWDIVGKKFPSTYGLYSR